MGPKFSPDNFSDVTKVHSVQLPNLFVRHSVRRKPTNLSRVIFSYFGHSIGGPSSPHFRLGPCPISIAPCNPFRHSSGPMFVPPMQSFRLYDAHVPPLLHHVSHIVRMRSKEKMCWIDTFPVVTMMENPKAIRDGANKKLPRNTGSSQHRPSLSLIPTDFAVPAFQDTTQPRPASIFVGSTDLGNKSTDEAFFALFGRILWIHDNALLQCCCVEGGPVGLPPTGPPLFYHNPHPDSIKPG
jgi:hypothetical protein